MISPGAEDHALAGIDLWETLRNEVLALFPGAADMLGRSAAAEWSACAPRERATIAVACLADIALDTASGRRQARALLAEFERDGRVNLGSDGPPASVREEAAVSYHDMKERRRAAMAADIAAVAADDFPRRLALAGGPVPALDCVEKCCSLIRGQRAARFLHELGYPLVLPDKPRRRFLYRFGLVADDGDGAARRREVLQLYDDLAQRCGVPAREINALLGFFTGADRPDGADEGPCRVKPQCAKCVLAAACDYGRLRGVSEDGLPRRNLSEALLPEDRPREKLATRGPDALTNAELLAILLRTGTNREHAVDLANRLLRDAGSLERLARMSLAELTKLDGLGTVKAITIKAALELARRVSAARTEDDAPITSARHVFDRLRGYFLERQKEYFLCLILNTKNRVIRQVLVSEGTLNQSLVHPREAFQDAMRDSASAVIFVHNHPSGDPSPSRDDHNITQRLVQAGDLLGIKVLDHVIVGRDRYFSFADEGELRK